jgi:hypothetical protein
LKWDDYISSRYPTKQCSINLLSKEKIVYESAW